MLVVALSLFWLMTHPPLPGWASWSPGVAGLLFVALWMYQVVVVVVSLPRTALPPLPTSFWRRFYARDAQDLSFAFSHFVMLCIFSLGMVINDEVKWPYVAGVWLGTIIVPVALHMKRSGPLDVNPRRPSAAITRGLRALLTALRSAPSIILCGI